MATSFDNEEDIEARQNHPITFLNRGEKIILSFLKAFFSQKRLFGSIRNDFYYTDNEDEGTLVVRMSEDKNINRTNAVPAITYQEGGFQENREFTGNKKDAKIGQGDRQRVAFYMPVTLHCLAQNKGSSKILQAVTTNALIMFRKAIYELGLDEISMINGEPPRKLSDQNDETGPYNSSITFNMKTALGWWMEPSQTQEEEIAFTFQAALEEIEYDENGNIISPPPEDIIKQKIQVNQ